MVNWNKNYEKTGTEWEIGKKMLHIVKVLTVISWTHYHEFLISKHVDDYYTP